MEDQQQPLNPSPLTADDLKNNSFLKVEKSTLQFQADVINVLEARVDIGTFPPDYQKKIKNYYRFSPVLVNSMAGKLAQVASQRVGKG